MGTRSVIKFQEDGNTICAVYQQYDGYPTGVGKQLFDFLDGLAIVNGLSYDNPKRVANGLGCLAAQFIAEHKDGAGGFYMTHPEDHQQYNYFVNCKWIGEGWNAKLSEPEISVISYDDTEFQGSLADFGLFIDSYNDDEEEVA